MKSNIKKSLDLYPEEYRHILSDEYRQLHVKPWSRFFAKTIDLFVISILFFILKVILIICLMRFSLSFFTNPAFILINYYLFFLIFILMESFFLATASTTLGRYLLGIKLTDLKGQKLKYKDAFHRSFRVFFAGLGLGIPIVSIITKLRAGMELYDTGKTSWDKNKFVVTHTNPNFIKKFIAFIFIIAYILCVGALAMQLVNKNLSTISATQFEEKRS